MAAAATAVKVPFPFRVIQSFIIVGGGTYLSNRLFPQDVENVLFDVADHVMLPVLHQIDAEDAHKILIIVAKHLPLFCPKDLEPDDPVLATTLWNLPFSNPVGAAAGMDKSGEVVGPLLNLGFGFVEVGSVTPKPQPGNPRPRIFRLDKDEAIINRCGFNSEGMVAVQRNLRVFENRRCDYSPGLLGVNVGKNKDTDASMTAEDYAIAIKRLGPSADYVVVNISSPNTPGLRSLAKDRDVMQQIVFRSCEARDEAVASRMKHQQNMALLPSNAQQEKKSGVITKSERPLSIPLFVKISPDISTEELDTLLDVVMSTRETSQGGSGKKGRGGGRVSAVDGLVVSNTTTSRPETLQSPRTLVAQTGGLSGVPLRDLSTQQVASVYLRTKGQIPIIGVGGISSGSDAFEKIAAGASLVQVYSMLTSRGPGSVRRVKHELASILREKGFQCVQDAVGTQAQAHAQTQAQAQAQALSPNPQESKST